jgi:hypothetical protein
MNALFELLREPPAQRLGFTLLHLLWQGAVLAALFELCRRGLRLCSANARYVAGRLTLALMAGAPVLTYISLSTPPPAPLPVFGPAPSGATEAGPLEAGPGRKEMGRTHWPR